MKAFLLAAGHGTRLHPLTDNFPKCLVPIRGVPLLSIWLQLCHRAAITDVFVNLNAHVAAVRNVLSHSQNGLRLRLSEEQVLLGSAGTLRANRDWVASDPEFWVLYSDVLTTFNLSKMMDFHRSRRPAATIGLYQVKDPSHCGVVLFDNQGVVRGFEEKPAHPKSNWVFSGLLIATPELLDAIPPQSPVDLGFHVLPKLAGRMLVYPISDYLLDIGTMEHYRIAQATWPGISD